MYAGSKVTKKGFPPKKGIIKQIISGERCEVVFDCYQKWEDYKNYPGEITLMSDLKDGWSTDLKDTTKGMEPLDIGPIL